MSDFVVTPEYLAALKSRDTRYAFVELATAISADLRDNETIKALVAAVRADGDQAMEDLAGTSPADAVAIADGLLRVRTLVYIRRTLNTILQRGDLAEQSLRAEDDRSDE